MSKINNCELPVLILGLAVDQIVTLILEADLESSVMIVLKHVYLIKFVPKFASRIAQTPSPQGRVTIKGGHDESWSRGT